MDGRAYQERAGHCTRCWTPFGGNLIAYMVWERTVWEAIGDFCVHHDKQAIWRLQRNGYFKASSALSSKTQQNTHFSQPVSARLVSREVSGSLNKKPRDFRQRGFQGANLPLDLLAALRSRSGGNLSSVLQKCDIARPRHVVLRLLLDRSFMGEIGHCVVL